MNQTKKNAMWISCCGCGKSVHLPETTKLIESDVLSIRLDLSTCPYCGFRHNILVSRWLG